MDSQFYESLEKKLEEIKAKGLYKEEREITSAKTAVLEVSVEKKTKKVLDFCSNNYLGLANDPEVIESAKQALDHYGFGLASVRFIAGTQTPHLKLEKKVREFLKTEDAILFSSCFDANGAIFEPLFSEDDAIFSDALNHASIIDGMRLSKAEKFRYSHADLNDLEDKLKKASHKKTKLIATDGVFSMDGHVADLQGICSLAEKYGALVMVDDCHATGFIGESGRGTQEACQVIGKIDFITGTFGKALGGSSGGFIAGKKQAIEFLRQRGRPYLFSNSLAPSIALGSMKALEIVENRPLLRKNLMENTAYFRDKMTQAGFDILPGSHPIVPVMLYDAKLAQEFAALMLEKNIYVIGFFYPVVPEGKARIRVQLSSSHTKEQIDCAIQAFIETANQLQLPLS